MLTKELKKYIVFPSKKKARPVRSFFELAKRHMIKSKDPRNRTLSKDIDKILYGAN